MLILDEATIDETILKMTIDEICLQSHATMHKFMLGF